MSGIQIWFASFVVLLVASLPLKYASSQSKLKAQYWEVADKWTNQTGLKRSLLAAGFETRAFDPQKGPADDCDVLVLGSFLSEDASYRVWAKSQAATLKKFVEDGGVVLQMTQADQTEATPAFLPDKLKIKRTDKDGETVLVSAEKHPLVARLPRRSSNTEQLALPMHHRRGSWESLHDQKGFRVLLTLDAANRDPVLVEAEVGKGRLLMTSLFFDKLDDRSGDVTAPQSFRVASEAFFVGLNEYVVAVRNGNSPQVVATPPYEPPAPWTFVPGSVTIVALPDTQVYSERFPQHFLAQTQWIVKNRERFQIAAVFHEGDITNRNTPEQWVNAQKAMQPLWGKLPVICAPGNHDMGPGGNGGTRSTLMSKYLPEKEFAEHASFQGTMEKGRVENNYSLFEAGGKKWIGIALEWAPRDRALEWADKLLTQHSERRAILVTHAYTYYDDSIYDITKTKDQNWSPYRYDVKSSAEGVNDGGDIWRKVIRKHENVVLVLSGHVLGDGAGRVTSKTKKGSPVHQVLANYQMLPEGGQGWLRLMEFLPDGETIQVRTYSPVLDRFNTDPQHQFRLRIKAVPRERGSVPQAAYPFPFSRPPAAGKSYNTWADAQGPDVDEVAVDPKRLPQKVDNSLRPEYPPIYNQGSHGVCGQYASVTSIFGYEQNVLNGTVATSDANRFSPYFSWNMMNRARNNGSEAYHGWEVAKRLGIPTAKTYGGVKFKSIGQWPDGYGIWREAMEYRLRGYRYSPVSTVEQLNEAKGWLFNRNQPEKTGGLLAMDGRMGRPPKRTFTIAKGEYEAGKLIWTRWNPTGFGHGLACVGYDDKVGFDVNGDGKITNDIDINKDGKVTLADWERGAYIVVNSWGKNWSADGKIYLLYSAMIDPKWKRGNYLGRIEVCRYQPRVTLRLKLSCSERSNLRVRIGMASDVSAKTAEHEIKPEVLNGWPLFKGSNPGAVPMAGPGTDKPIELGVDVSELFVAAGNNGNQKSRLFLRFGRATESKAVGQLHSCAVRFYDIQGKLIREIPIEIQNGKFGEKELVVHKDLSLAKAVRVTQ